MNSVILKDSLDIKKIFSDDELSLLDLTRIPEHIAIIMDGNRRWAKRHHLPCMVGHWKGAERLTSIVKAASLLGVKVLTVFAFSTENWTRASLEVQALMELFRTYLIKQRNPMVDEGVKLGFIGDITKLPHSVREVLEETKAATAGGKEIELVIAMNYGGRDEIRRATLSILEDFERGLLRKEDLCEETFSSYLDTHEWEDPDLLIRTSGEKRISNFLLWQVSYSEVYITDVLWPDFDEKELLRAVLEYQRRERRLGGA